MACWAAPIHLDISTQSRQGRILAQLRHHCWNDSWFQGKPKGAQTPCQTPVFLSVSVTDTGILRTSLLSNTSPCRGRWLPHPTLISVHPAREFSPLKAQIKIWELHLISSYLLSLDKVSNPEPIPKWPGAKLADWLGFRSHVLPWD